MNRPIFVSTVRRWQRSTPFSIYVLPRKYWQWRGIVSTISYSNTIDENLKIVLTRLSLHPLFTHPWCSSFHVNFPQFAGQNLLVIRLPTRARQCSPPTNLQWHAMPMCWSPCSFVELGTVPEFTPPNICAIFPMLCGFTTFVLTTKRKSKSLRYVPRRCDINRYKPRLSLPFCMRIVPHTPHPSKDYDVSVEDFRFGDKKLYTPVFSLKSVTTSRANWNIDFVGLLVRCEVVSPHISIAQDSS